MDPTKIDVSVIARELKISPEQVEKTLQLLDEGNTIPFLTRFRKDETGGLHEEQILAIKTKATQLRALAERKASVLKSIEAQGELTDELAEQIRKATSSRRLEDIYLPFKTRKQSRASLARQQGLEPLALEILESGNDVDFATRATDFVRVDKGLNTVDEVIKGVGDLLAERFAENEQLRLELRKLVRSTGMLTSKQIEVAEKVDANTQANDKPKQESAQADSNKNGEQTDSSNSASPAVAEASNEPASDASSATVQATQDEAKTDAPSDKAESPSSTAASESTSDSEAAPAPAADTSKPEATIASLPGAKKDSVAGESPAEVDAKPLTQVAENNSPSESAEEQKPDDASAGQASEDKVKSGGQSAGEAAAPKKRKKKKKKKKGPDPFRDYHDFEQSINKTPHHRVLAINRGERAGKLRVKIRIDNEKANEIASRMLVPEGHPSEEFLRKCASDTVSRSILPSIEREIRRELTEAAEKHAVDIFSRNLKTLLLQAPVRNRVVLAIDPGYKRGCSVAILDPFGRLIESGQVFVVGNQQRREESGKRLADWIVKHKVDLVAIGNGTGCRQVELMVSNALAAAREQYEARYIIVNEAGTSIYSTSETGREELPDQSPAVRSAMSIGRRLQDPLSELVKISPANIGVGMYQHDVKQKHLTESLDEVVQSCVNRVGVDVNTASASLLKHVSGMNALTARRVIEYRDQNGRFNHRDELKNVSGVGDTTYIQAAGFLRIHGGENPLDATSIHPESYPIAEDILKRLDATVENIFPRWMLQPKKEEMAQQQPLVQQPPAIEQPQAEEGSGQANEPTSNPPGLSEKAPGGPAESTPSKAAEASTSQETSTTVTAHVDAATGDSQPSEAAPIDDSVPEAAPADHPATSESAQQTSAASVDKDASSSGDAAESESPATTSSENATTRREFDQRRKALVKQMNELDIEAIAKEHQSGKLLVKDVLQSLKRPGWDPREKAKKPLFRTGIVNLDDLKTGMELQGQIVNVVDFGVFVDIGLGESSLVHVSQLSNHYISDPSRNFHVGDVLKVWVTEIDTKRRRVKLTSVRPGTDKPAGRRKPRRGQQTDNKPRGGREGGRKPGKYEGRKGGAHGGGTRERRPRRQSRASKPVRPITDEMLRGDEPMKTFSDLAQFLNKRPEDKKRESQSADKGTSSEENEK